MRIGLKRRNAVTAGPAMRVASDVAKLRPIENFRVCPECLVVNVASDLFCTGCGREMPITEWADSAADADLGRDDTAARPAALPSPLPEVFVQPVAPDSAPLSRRRRRATAAALALVVLAVAASATFGVLFLLQRSHANHLSHQLRSTREHLAATRTRLKETEASLAAARSLSDKRRAVLVRARAVLAGVDPILSSVDELQRDTADIQSERGTFATKTDTLMNDLVALANYAIQTDPAYIDQSYLDQLIYTANADLDTVRAEESTLGSYDSSYNTASERFGNRADAFTKSVRRLQKQLKQVANK